MAEFITKCPHCNAELQAQDEWIGMEVECPQCKKTFTVYTTNTDNDNSSQTDSQKINTTTTPPPPFNGKNTSPVTPPPFNGKTSARGGVKASNSEINPHIKQKMDLYIVAMAFAVFIFAVSFPIALGMLNFKS